MLYRFVDEQKAEGFPIERICRDRWRVDVGVLRLEETP